MADSTNSPDALNTDQPLTKTATEADTTGKLPQSGTLPGKKVKTSKVATKKPRTGKKKTTKKKANKTVAKKVVAKAAVASRVANDGSEKNAKTASVRKGALVIVESPAKAKTIKKYLGRGYTVKASVGHIKDLPKSQLSVDIDNEFTPNYEVIRGKSKVIKEIKDAARTAENIYLAPDPDREGEAIAWHIADELGKRHEGHIYRITFNEITKRAVQEALQNPTPLDKAKYEAQQARRILDRIVGYQISPILWDKVRRGLSAGRVQSVAVRLVVEREREIAAFVPEEYWAIECQLAGDNPPPFFAKVIKENGEKFRPNNGDHAALALKTLSQAQFRVDSVIRKERRRRPNPPLITSKLQQEAANRLRFTAKRTMMVAQQLYEGVEIGTEGSVGLITYMRTDSTRISAEAVVAVREHIDQAFGKDFLPEQPNIYKSKKSAQDAHEAVRPTSMEYPPEKVAPYLSKDQNKLYQLIWRWFVACQMVPAVYDQTTVDIAADRFTLRSTGSVLKFAGFLAAYGVGEEVEDEIAEVEEKGAEAQEGILPMLEENEQLQCNKIDPQQKFTQPPPRFSESSLVKELEVQGIGRPSTYAAIMSTIVSRNYVTKEDGRFYPSELGFLITDLLMVSFPRILDVEFTARMEEQLDKVEEGSVDWIELLKDFYHGGFKDSVEKAKVEMRNVKREEIPTEHHCEKCGENMVIKWGRNGSFLACLGYPKCRTTREYKRRVDSTIEILPEQTTDEVCPTCAGSMVVKRGRYGKFLACRAYPDCKGTRPMPIGVVCPQKCGGYVVERRSNRGRIFFGCSSYPNCTFAAWNRPVEGPCPTCNHSYLIRKWTKRDGVTISCPQKDCDYKRDPELDDEDQKAVTD